MSITSNANRVRVESSAKNGTLGSQAGAAANQIIFDTNISTNNGNLETGAVFRRRHVVLRRGTATEEFGLIQSVEADGVTCNMFQDWDDPPASGDAYDVSYRLEDCATIAGCDFEATTRQWNMTKRLIVGVGASTFGFLGMSHGQILRCDDRGATQSALLINEVGYFAIGTLKNKKSDGSVIPERGAGIIFTNNADDELAMEIEGEARMYEFTMSAARSHEGVTGLRVTHAVGSDVKWARAQLHGMNAPYKKREKRYTDVAGEVLISVTDIKNSETYKGWLKSELDQSIVDYIDSEAGINEVSIVIEEE